MSLKTVVRFGLVGGLATLVHLLVGGTLIMTGTSPTTANVIAFAVAFFVSFAGHYGYSFASHNAPMARSLRRFVIVALIGWGTNQTVLVLRIKLTHVQDLLALGISTTCGAAVTFTLSKYWAFLSGHKP